jgi:hypothetical protein
LDGPPRRPYYVGIDVSKARLDVALLPSGESFVVSNNEEGFDELVGRLEDPHPILVVLAPARGGGGRARPPGGGAAARGRRGGPPGARARPPGGRAGGGPGLGGGGGGHDATGARRHRDHAIGQQDGLLDRVGDEHNRLLALPPDSLKLERQLLPR